MPYTLLEDCILLTTDSGNLAIPRDVRNIDYQEVLDSINTDGATAWDDSVSTYDDIDETLRAAAEAKLFDKQLSDYRNALERLARREVGTAVAEQTEEVEDPSSPLTYNEDTMSWEHSTITIVTQKAVEAEPATVEVISDDAEGNPVTTTIENPLITRDKEERAAAQAVVDATPQAVKDAA